MTERPREYLSIGGVTPSFFGDRRALRVRAGRKNQWEWREITDDEYRVMLDALNASLTSRQQGEQS